ncbi:MAG: hypothetical protein LBG88_03200 [Christensenellaceae bacterium]|nr:hypothetical protein [Christensenellaceae bacterium]
MNTTGRKLGTFILATTLLLGPTVKANAGQGLSPNHDTNVKTAIEDNSPMWYLKKVAESQDSISTQKKVAIATINASMNAVMNAQMICAAYGRGNNIELINQAYDILDQAFAQTMVLDQSLATLYSVSKNIKKYDRAQLSEIALWLPNMATSTFMTVDEIRQMCAMAIGKAQQATAGIQIPQTQRKIPDKTV